jgi:GT2 family glycosyltransferase
MDISVIIVSWNVRDLLKKCLESIFRHTQDVAFEVIMVDNASTDGTLEMLKHYFPNVKLIANQKNLGFAKANNIGIREAQGEYILLLNPDTEFIENSLEKVVQKMESDENIGVLGCRILNSDKSLQPSVRRFPTLASQLIILLKLHRLFPSLLNNYLAKDFDYSKEAEAVQVMGAFFCVSRTVFEQIGLLDEEYFIWFEEVDFCRRAKKVGYKVIYCPEISIIHHSGQSFAQVDTLKKQWWFFRSALHYFSKQ